MKSWDKSKMLVYDGETIKTSTDHVFKWILQAAMFSNLRENAIEKK